MTATLIIPFHNASDRIAEILKYSITEKQNCSVDLELIFVNDGSTDNSLAIASKFEQYGVNIISYSEQKGMGYAVARGAKAATGEYVGIMTPSFVYGFEPIAYAIEALTSEGANLACGNRHLSKSRGFSTVKKISMSLKNTRVLDFVDLGVRDPFSMFYLFEKKVGDKIFSKSVVHNEFFAVELLGLAKMLGYKTIEIPLDLVNTDLYESEDLLSSKTLFENLKLIRTRLLYDEFY